MIFLANLTVRVEQHARASAGIMGWGTLLILAIGLGSAFVVMLRHVRAHPQQPPTAAMYRFAAGSLFFMLVVLALLWYGLESWNQKFRKIRDQELREDMTEKHNNGIRVNQTTPP
ncbi:MAG: hypothetical protein H7210_14635 [Pyrinomonadaceae bacterium]|nr:hypothetical protein [Phycisphaerales bacterium]